MLLHPLLPSDDNSNVSRHFWMSPVWGKGWSETVSGWEQLLWTFLLQCPINSDSPYPSLKTSSSLLSLFLFFLSYIVTWTFTETTEFKLTMDSNSPLTRLSTQLSGHFWAVSESVALLCLHSSVSVSLLPQLMASPLLLLLLLLAHHPSVLHSSL